MITKPQISKDLIELQWMILVSRVSGMWGLASALEQIARRSA